jgi:hypothetical protein
MGYSIFDETMVDMAWPDIERAATHGAIVLLPAGIIEEHGPHLGLAVDIYINCLLSVLAKKLEATRLTDDDLKGLGRSDVETRKLIPQGYFGDPSGYDMDIARQYVEASALDLADTIERYLDSR